MVFNSLIFIFCFLPITWILTRIVPTTFLKNLVLFIFSLLFYSWNDPFYVLLLLISIAWNYLTGLELEKETGKTRKIVFWSAIAFNLFILGAFKYTNFLLGIFGLEGFDFALPVGLSFFTFSAISYLADVYKNDVPAQKNPLSLGLYIAFFGKISSGPIAFYRDMESQFQNHPMNFTLFCEGLTLFTKGLIKKALFADSFALVFSSLATNTSMAGAWLYALSYMMQIYFDFSGYSDMAIGVSNMFGFKLKINFDHPYSAKSIQDFWRRWHISLSTWFRDYVYIPLGGNRHDYVRNILIVWFLTGLWHGSNWTFILWGLYYGGLILLEKFVLSAYLDKLPMAIRRIYTFVLVLFGWVFFFSDSILSAFGTFGHMFNFMNICDSQALFVLVGHIPLFVLGFLLTGELFDKVEQFCFQKGFRYDKIVYTSLYLIGFLISVAFVVGSTYQSFLYFAF